jgi:uncharacterized membrane protein YheB (UPF0754 family)
MESYLLMPLTYGFIGYLTNIVALWMTFYPVEFRGIPPYIGWQGIVARRSGALALKSVNLLSEKVLKLDQFFSRLPVDQLQKTYQKILEHNLNTLFVDGSIQNKAELIEEIKTSSSLIISNLGSDFKAVFNFKALVLRSLSGPNAKVLVEVFQYIGDKEFKLIKNSGWIFGGLLGLIQAFVWNYLPISWLLPIQGVIVGYLTNWIALRLIFRPLNPWHIGPIKIQGLFLKRQNEVSQRYAYMFQKQVLNGRNILSEVLYKRTFKVINEKAQLNAIELSSDWRDKFELEINNGMKELEDMLDRVMKVEKTLAQSMASMPTAEFEPLLRSAFQEDEIILLIFGSILGAIVGAAQIFLL